jgi:hypothetical protein
MADAAFAAEATASGLDASPPVSLGGPGAEPPGTAAAAAAEVSVPERGPGAVDVSGGEPVGRAHFGGGLTGLFWELAAGRDGPAAAAAAALTAQATAAAAACGAQSVVAQWEEGMLFGAAEFGAEFWAEAGPAACEEEWLAAEMMSVAWPVDC